MAVRPLLHIWVFALWLALCSVLGISTTFAATNNNSTQAGEVIASKPDPSSALEAALKAALEHWLKDKLARADHSGPRHEFASLNDKRLSIPACAEFEIDPQDGIDVSTLATTLAVPVRCSGQNGSAGF